MFSVQRDRINTLKVRSAGEVKPALRLAVKNEISQLHLQPAGMSPSAVLLVRHLLDPRLNRQGSSRNINSKAWRQAVRDQLQDAYRRAVRPNGNGVSGDPHAVLFRDHAELVATLSIDIVANCVAGKWWWRSFSFRSSRVSSQLRDVLQARMETVPAVFAILSRREKAFEVVKSLDGGDACHLAQAVLHQFGFRQLSSNLITAQQQYAQANTQDKFDANLVDAERGQENHKPQFYLRIDDSVDSPEQKRASINTSRPPPWAVLLGEKSWSAGLSREQNALLGISQMLHAATAMVRNSSFQRELVCWWQSADQGLDDRYQPENPTRERHKRELASENSNATNNKIPGASIEVVQGKTNAAELFENDIGDMEGNKTERFYELTQEGSDVTELEPGATARGSKFDENDGIAFDANNGFNPKPVGPGEIENSLPASDGGAKLSPASVCGDERKPGPKTIGIQRSDSEELPLDELDEELDLRYAEIYIDTGLGGVLYVINLLRQLGIPEHFNESWLLDRQISYWAMTEIIARALMGRLFLKCDNDPIWRILAKLDRRRNRFPVAPKYRCSADYIIPARWFQYFLNDEEENIFWGAYRNRLRVWTKDIPLIDMHIDSGSDSQQVAKEQMRRLTGEETVQAIKLKQRPFKDAPLDNRSQFLRLGVNKDLATWLSLVLPAIRCYLQSALSLDSASSTSILKSLFALQARIYISACHIDLVADVNQSSLVLRRSGLDQDPGWQPEFGRVILFHFQ